MPLGISFESLPRGVQSDVFANAGDDILQRPPFRHVIQHIIRGDQPYRTIADGPSEIYGNVINNSAITITNTTATFFNNVTNAAGGTIKTTSAISRFLATFINNGSFISDPSDNFFESLSMGPTGALIGGRGDHFILKRQ